MSRRESVVLLVSRGVATAGKRDLAAISCIVLIQFVCLPPEISAGGE
jgi:hypothetical protein